MTKPAPLHLFQAYGIELEYMIVDKDTLQVKPISDELLKHQLGLYGGDYENGIITWSNELVLHVIELKSTRPESNFNSMEHAFADNITIINKILSKWNAMLMPTAAHPFMNPSAETKLWPHDNNEVYEIYNKIFDCKGHGWSNLQSTHLNLPFQGDKEFGRLHAAIRLLLPLLPALCASSPLLDGKASGYVDTRLTFYKTNQARIPSITGQVIPEAIFLKESYEQEIYSKIKKDIAAFNHDDILDPIWVNSRGAIPRFDRGSIEIRVMDIQECPAADLAIVVLVTETLKALVDEKILTIQDQKEVPTTVLSGILEETIKTGQATEIYSTEYSSLFGINSFTTPKQIWIHIYETLIKEGNTSLERWEPQLSIIFQEGTLSDRILKALNGNFAETSIRKVYRQLGDCLAQNKMFIP
jgi:gamma-glutamyl:cysteine ligase YbdK (ATP-grasp superfamily)